MGFHSVILRPDSVSRVKPPMTTMPKTSAEQPKSHFGKDRGIAADVDGGGGSTLLAVVAESRATVDSRRKEGEKKLVDRATGWKRCE